MVLFLDSTLFSYVKGRVGSPASGGTLFQDEAVLWCEERSDTMAYSMTTDYNNKLYRILSPSIPMLCNVSVHTVDCVHLDRF